MQRKVKNDVLKPDVEKLLEDIDSGKVKMTRYNNVDEYLKHIDDHKNLYGRDNRP